MWDGKEVAVKQFDVRRPGAYNFFKKEVAAYNLLQAAQGILIPKALFLSTSVCGGVKYLGLQKGRDPRAGDDVTCWPNVLESLKRDYGFIHRDADGRNGLIITNSNSVETLVTIDLEEYRLTGRGRILMSKLKK